MSNIKIKDLPEKTDNLQDDDLVVLEDTEDTKKISLIRLKSAFSMDSILISIKEMLIDKINSFIESHNTRYKELNDRNKQLEVICNNLENDHIHDANRIFELEDRLVKQTELVKNLQNDNNTLSESLVELVTEKEFISLRLKDLEQQFLNKEYEYTDLTDKFENLQNDYNTLVKENNNLKDIVLRLESDTSISIDSFINDKTVELSTSIDEILSYIRYYHPDVDDLEV